ncbi:hypothetical protein SLEP1_g1227 [Rubroshorea leprosula]|uniref:Uncharacterized protein n=1 Tax=Rubroshorea leprosula TaxID=152421 RepID=A0AAV5HP12_9ROSI|nr:hypothetical protein SLEP1_g1227 [Rubroshorea leprosula]
MILPRRGGVAHMVRRMRAITSATRKPVRSKPSPSLISVQINFPISKFVSKFCCCLPDGFFRETTKECK